MASTTIHTPANQHSKADIEAFQATFGSEFLLAGGLESTVEMARLLQDKLKKIGNETKILDVGCGGIGAAAFYFASTYGARVDVIDINPSAIDVVAEETAKKRKLDHLVMFQVMDVLKDDTIEANTYDIIYSRDALSHIPHESKLHMYQQFYKFLKPNGILCVGDYCIGEKSGEKRNPDLQANSDQREYYLHSAAGWKDALQQAGFENDQIEIQDRALWYCQTCQREVDQVGIPGSPGNTEYLKKFGQEKLDGLIGSNRDNITMILRGDRSYVIITAQKAMVHSKLRETVCNAYKTMSANGWIISADGNASARVPENNTTCLLTPSGVMVPDLKPSKIVWADIATGKSMPGETYKPTSEVALHTLIYKRRPDVGAIVHCHSIYTCALACCRLSLPPSHYAVCELLQDLDFSSPTGGSTIVNPEDLVVQCAPYHTYGTKKLAQITVDALGKNRAVLMAAHGAIVTGKDMEEALYNCERLERECEIYWRSMQYKSIASPKTLTLQEIKDHTAAEGSYGQDHPDISSDDALQAAAAKTK